MIAVAAAVLLIAYPLRYVLIPFAVAGGMAFATSPAVDWLQRRLRFPHVAAVLAVFVADLGRRRRFVLLDWYDRWLTRLRNWPSTARPYSPNCSAT